MTNGRRRATLFLSLTVLPGSLLMTGACDAPRQGARIEPATQSPEAQDSLTPRPSTSSPEAGEAIGPAPEDLRTVDWAKTPVPGDVCAVPGLVRFDEQGQAWATSRTWGRVLVEISPEVDYGDIDGDGRDEAAVTVGCHNGGGTGGGRLAWGGVVFGRSGGDLAVIGTITTRQRLPQTSATQIEKMQIAPQQVVVYEKWYRRGDATCCPSGTATTVWTREGNRLVPGDPRITS
ncbi:hypothetical protein [Streptomyces sp. NPDC002587]